MTQDEIRKLPHKVINGIAIALTEEEIAIHNTPQPIEERIANAKESKKTEVKALRAASLSADLLAKVIDGKSYYVKTDPEINIFQSAILLADNASRTWGCYVDGEKELVELFKSELLNIAHHYEERKNQEYNLCDKRRAEIDTLSTIEEVEAFDINKVYE